MSVDIKSYLAKIPENKNANDEGWSRGLGSEFAIIPNVPYFFKRRGETPLKVHNFIVNGNLNAKLKGISPNFEDYLTFSEADYQQIGYTDIGRNKFDKIYVFKKADLVKFEKYFKDAREYLFVLRDLATFFYVVDQEGVIYHDADAQWNNICINKTTGRLCIVDIDSMELLTETHESLSTKGSYFLHNSYLAFKDKYKLTDIKYLNVCIYHNIFLSLIH